MPTPARSDLNCLRVEIDYLRVRAEKEPDYRIAFFLRCARAALDQGIREADERTPTRTPGGPTGATPP